MLMKERQRQILDILSHEKHISVKELASHLSASHATIRNDLNEMAENNLLIRTHGGASIIDHESILKNHEFNLRTQINTEEKVAIAKLAFSHIVDGDTILIDGSSTCYELAKLLVSSKLRITVLTNGFATANLLKDNANITTVIIGGILKNTSNAIESTLGAGIIRNLNINKLFISAYSFSLEHGLSDFNLYEVELKKLMIENIQKRYALIDSSKLEKNSSVSFATPHQIDYLLTDNGISSDLLAKYQDSGVQVLMQDSVSVH